MSNNSKSIYKKGVLLKDVAAQAGVSPATASLIINQKDKADSFLTETKKRVFLAAEKLNYRPHFAARGLRLKKNSQICIDIPNVFHPYMPLLIKGIGNVARKNNYYLLILDTTNLGPTEIAEHVSILRHGAIDGILTFIGKHFSKNVECFPVVYIDEYAYKPVVRFDAEQAAYEVTSLFTQRNHNRIAFISSNVRTDTFIMRERGYKKALNDYGLKCDPGLVIEVPVNLEGGINAAKWMANLSSPPTAAVVCTDVIALSFLYSLKNIGIEVPNKLAVGSIDNVPQAAFTNPPLTSVNVPAYEIGSRAAELLIRIINGEDLQNEVEVVPTSLVIRTSSEQ